MRLTNKVRDLLRETYKSATLQRAGFGSPVEGLNATVSIGGKDTGLTVDEFIKERTRIYRESWILPRLAEVLGADAQARGETIDFDNL